MKKMTVPHLSRFAARMLLALLVSLVSAPAAWADDFDICDVIPSVIDPNDDDVCCTGTFNVWLTFEGTWDGSIQYYLDDDYDFPMPVYFVNAGGDRFDPEYVSIEDDGIVATFPVSIPAGTLTLHVDAATATMNGVANPAITYDFTLKPATTFVIRNVLWSFSGEGEDEWSLRSVTSFDITAPAGYTFSRLLEPQVTLVTYDDEGMVVEPIDANFSLTTDGLIHADFATPFTGNGWVQLRLEKGSVEAIDPDGNTCPNLSSYSEFYVESTPHFLLYTERFITALPFTTLSFSVPRGYTDCVANPEGEVFVDDMPVDFSIVRSADGRTFTITLAQPITEPGEHNISLSEGFITATDPEGNDCMSYNCGWSDTFGATPSAPAVEYCVPERGEHLSLNNIDEKWFEVIFRNDNGQCNLTTFTVDFPDGTHTTVGQLMEEGLIDAKAEAGNDYFWFHILNGFTDRYASHFATDGNFGFTFPAGSILSASGVTNASAIVVSYSYTVAKPAECVGTFPVTDEPCDLADLPDDAFYRSHVIVFYNDYISSFYDADEIPAGVVATNERGEELRIEYINGDDDYLLFKFADEFYPGETVTLCWPDDAFTLYSGMPVPAGAFTWNFITTSRFDELDYALLGEPSKYELGEIISVTGIKVNTPGLLISPDCRVACSNLDPKGNIDAATTVIIPQSECNVTLDADGCYTILFPAPITADAYFEVMAKSFIDPDGSYNNPAAQSAHLERAFDLRINLPEEDDLLPNGSSISSIIVHAPDGVRPAIDYIVINGKRIAVTATSIGDPDEPSTCSLALAEPWTTPGVVIVEIPAAFMADDDGYASRPFRQDFYIELPGNEFVLHVEPDIESLWDDELYVSHFQITGFTVSFANSRYPFYSRMTADPILLDGEPVEFSTVSGINNQSLINFELAEPITAPGNHVLTIPAGHLVDMRTWKNTATTQTFVIDYNADPDADGIWYTTDDAEFIRNAILENPSPTTGPSIGNLVRYINIMQ